MTFNFSRAATPKSPLALWKKVTYRSECKLCRQCGHMITSIRHPHFDFGRLFFESRVVRMKGNAKFDRRILVVFPTAIYILLNSNFSNIIQNIYYFFHQHTLITLSPILILNIMTSPYTFHCETSQEGCACARYIAFSCRQIAT